MFIGINTAVSPFSIGAWRPDGIVFERSMRCGYDFTENLYSYIQEGLVQSGRSFDDVTGVGVVQGPGSYTGLRLGITTAKTIGQVRQIPVVPVETLPAFLVDQTHHNALYLVTMPSVKGQCNAALLRIRNGRIERLTQDFVCPESAVEKWQSRLRGITIIQSESGKFSLRGAAIARYAYQQRGSGVFDSASQFNPIYLYQPHIGGVSR